MPDVYTTIASAGPAVIDRLVGILEQRAADHRQVSMRRDYLDRLELPPAAVVLEVGCGTGAIARELDARADVARVIAVDTSEQLMAAARRLSVDHELIQWHVAAATALPIGDGQVDAVIFHTVLCHLTDPLAALAEARRVLKPGGRIAVFDGDYASLTFATERTDPLEAVAVAAIAEIAHDPYLVRRLPTLLRQAGFAGQRQRHYLYRADDHPAYLRSLVERGLAALVRDGRITTEVASEWQGMVERRIAAGGFVGQVAYAAIIARTNRTRSGGSHGN